MINPGVVAAIHVAGVRGDPCGAVRWAQSNSPNYSVTLTRYRSTP